MEEPSQFSVGQTPQSLTCSIMEKPHTELDECPDNPTFVLQSKELWWRLEKGLTNDLESRLEPLMPFHPQTLV